MELMPPELCLPYLVLLREEFGQSKEGIGFALWTKPFRQTVVGARRGQEGGKKGRQGKASEKTLARDMGKGHLRGSLGGQRPRCKVFEISKRKEVVPCFGGDTLGKPHR